MPIYEYECENCACRFELKRRFGEDDGSPSCPQCQGKVHQLFSPPAILFKGSGFYVTDSRNEDDRPPEKGKAGKVKGGGKEEGEANKVESGGKEEGEANKVESGRKEEVKADKVERSKKEEST